MQASKTASSPTGTSRTRTGRWSGCGQVYHIVTAVRDRRPVCADFSCARAVIASLRRQDRDSNARTLAFVVMPDHLHWLMQLGTRRPLASVVRQVKCESALRINGIMAAAGPVWQRGYYDRAIRANEDLPSIARYIVANPLRDGLVRQIGDYPHWDACWLN
ncbi:MAG TPA: transposase, partial [Woeseiaceae bacterium]|nr:transposase [Woeseiaceae bacterium]